jgi:hypothetical protein
MADADQDILQWSRGRCGIVDIVGRGIIHPDSFGQPHQRHIQTVVLRQQVMLQFQPEPLPTKDLAVVDGLLAGLRRLTVEQGLGYAALPTPGKGDQTGRMGFECVWRQAGLTFGSLMMGESNQVAQILPSGRIPHQQREMRVIRQCQFCAEDRLNTLGACRLCEPHRSVDGIVVGEGQRIHAQRGGAFDQCLRGGCAIQQTEIRMRVEFGVGMHETAAIG